MSGGDWSQSDRILSCSARGATCPTGDQFHEGPLVVPSRLVRSRYTSVERSGSSVWIIFSGFSKQIFSPLHWREDPPEDLVIVIQGAPWFLWQRYLRCWWIQFVPLFLLGDIHWIKRMRKTCVVLWGIWIPGSGGPSRTDLLLRISWSPDRGHKPSSFMSVMVISWQPIWSCSTSCLSGSSGQTGQLSVFEVDETVRASFSVSDPQLCFNFNMKNFKIFSGSKENQFGYTVQQHEAGGRQWWESQFTLPHPIQKPVQTGLSIFIKQQSELV